jgi:catechol 2,3-dioxygenase-like lactoylglutathione lyase family enzyme
MRIVEFAFIVYPATDLARSRAFYEGVLGLTSATSINVANGFWVEYEIGPHTLAIGNEPFLKPSGDGPHLVLEVDDFDKTIEHLRRHKVQFALEPSDMPLGCRAAIVLDPDGNKSAFINERLKHALQRIGPLRFSFVSHWFYNIISCGGRALPAPVNELGRYASRGSDHEVSDHAHHSRR